MNRNAARIGIRQNSRVRRRTQSDRLSARARSITQQFSGLHRTRASGSDDHHGATKLRNVFPEAFDGGPPPPSRQTPEPDEVLDYEDIGNLTIKQARELEVGADIAILTGLTEATINRKLRDLHGGGIVRRQFNWYEPSTIGELTVKTALDYGVASLLARVFGRTRASVLASLGKTAGQTELRTIFPDLER